MSRKSCRKSLDSVGTPAYSRVVPQRQSLGTFTFCFSIAGEVEPELAAVAVALLLLPAAFHSSHIYIHFYSVNRIEARSIVASRNRIPEHLSMSTSTHVQIASQSLTRIE